MWRSLVEARSKKDREYSGDKWEGRLGKGDLVSRKEKEMMKENREAKTKSVRK